MSAPQLGIRELADATGLTVRAVRFYVQRQLLPPPNGRGRGNHYDQRHLDRLIKILELQQSGYSLDAIRQMFRDEAAPPPKPPNVRRPNTRTISTELWRRIRLLDGVELHFNSTRHEPDLQTLQSVRDLILRAFRSEPEEGAKQHAGDET